MFGFYHVSDVNNRYGTRLAADIETMGKAGFNWVEFTVTGPDALKSSELARAKAKQYNMGIIASYYKPSMQKWVSDLKNDTSIMGWNVSDDFNVPYSSPAKTPGLVKSENQTLKDYTKSQGLQTFTYGSGGGYPFKSGQIPYLFGSYAGSAMDIVGVQSYPISNNDGAFKGTPLEESIEYFKYARSQMPKSVPVVANVQTFAWSGGRYPTPQEGRNMVYGAVAKGLKAILAYAFHEESGTLPTKKPDLWQEFVKLRAEINGDFAKAIMTGKQTIIDTQPAAYGKAKIHATIWEYYNPKVKKTQYYILVLNTSSKQTLSATKAISLPFLKNGRTIKSLAKDTSRYVTTMKANKYAEGDYLDGAIPAMGVGVYIAE